MKQIQNTAAFFFIMAVMVLSVVSIFGIWDFVNKDVIIKSFQTLGLLATVAVIVIGAGHFMENRSPSDPALALPPNPVFKSIRKSTVAVLITSVSLLALLGILAIWDVITNREVLHRALGSIGVIVFSSFIIVMTCLDREGNLALNGNNRKFSTGGLILIIILVYIFFMFVRFFF
jgi:hypothetical protein